MVTATLGRSLTHDALGQHLQSWQQLQNTSVLLVQGMPADKLEIDHVEEEETDQGCCSGSMAWPEVIACQPHERLHAWQCRCSLLVSCLQEA